MPTPRSVYDQAVEDAITDARRRASATDQELLAKDEHRPYPSPEDWRDVCIYFLMVDRFNNPGEEPRSTTAPGNPTWDMHYASRQGGTIAGITAQLPYLKQLGIGAIWVTPLMRNCAADWMMTYHGYSAQDMLAVDERWTSGEPDPIKARDKAEAELVAMVRAAHDLGIRVILDVVINHTGMVFRYDRNGTIVDEFQDRDLLSKSQGGGALPGVVWNNGYGQAVPAWRDALQPGQASHRDDAVYPVELRDSWLFRRRGTKFNDSLHEFPSLEFVPGDFGAMRQLGVEYTAADDDLPRRNHGRFPALAVLLRIYQYWISRFDLDGFRMDTVKYIHPKFIQRFGTAISEFAYSIGKKNFFVFGEVWEENDHIAAFVGRNRSGTEGFTGGFGIDAALDFPLQAAIRGTCTGKLEDRTGVNSLRDVFDERRRQQEELICSHGDASNYFVTFPDSHDQKQRIRHPSSPDAEVRLCLGLLYTLPGIPCLYYGTEQDLVGTHAPDLKPRLDSLESVREALWGKFGKNSPSWPMGSTFQMLKALAETRAGHAPLRYGRHYFRQVSGDGVSFGWSMDKGGVFAFSRIYAEAEVLVVAYPNPFRGWPGWVEVDADASKGSSVWKVVFSTLGNGGTYPAKLFSWNPNRRAVQVSLKSNELLVLVPDS